jgi:hypothetical protein
MRLARTAHRFLFVCALGVAGLHAPASEAQTSASKRPERPLAESLQGAAKEAYTAAGLLHNRGEYAAAATKYEEAYDLSKDPRLLFNIAACEKELHKYARMGAYLRRFKAESGARISDEDRKDVDDALAALKGFVGSVSVVSDAAGAIVAVDGETVGTTPLSGPLLLDAGKHTIRLRKDGAEDVDKEVDVAAGSETSVSITLAAASSARPAPAAEPLAPPPQPARGGYGPLVYGGFVVGGVGLVTGAVTGMLALSHASSVTSACQGTVCPTSVDGDLHDARTLGNASTVAFVAAGAGAAVGLVAILLSRRSEARAPAAASISPWVTPTGAGLRGSF